MVLLVLLTLVALEVVVPVILDLIVLEVLVLLVVMEHDILLNMVQITQHIMREAAEVLAALEVLLMVLVV